MKVLYGSTIALSAFLLFSVEPMVTRALMPSMGGSSAVWMTALAFFQLALLAGYGYAVWLTRRGAMERFGGRVHLVLLTLAVVSLAFSSARPSPLAAGGTPQLRLFLLLAVAIGLPFVTLSTTAPLLQVWFARHQGTAIPYRLFALSNLASLAALLAYPTLLERFVPLNAQFTFWKAAFVCYALLVALVARHTRSHPDTPASPSPDPAQSPPRRTRLLWFALPALASLQLAAVTAHLVQDVAAMPLLWVLPLAAYLLSFVLAFDLPRVYRRGVVLRMLAVLLFALGYFLMQTTVNIPIGLSIVLFTAELFFAAWFFHAELFALRPVHEALSPHFYLYLAAGGATGTLAVAVLSPLLTRSNFDLPVSFLLTVVLILVTVWRESWPSRIIWLAGAALGVFLLFTLHQDYSHDALFRDRNFYGSLRVKQTQLPPQAYLSRSLYNGSIQHGMQWFSSEFHHTPLTYYTPDSGIGLALDHCCSPARPRHIGVIGLGAGTLAAYGRPGDRIRFYDINPMVTDVAQHLFTFTRDTPASVTIVPGDARLRMASEPGQNFDVLAVDAFSGDSIPTHLLTREALTLFLRHLSPDGILAFHISNRYLDLAPVLARLVLSSSRMGDPALSARQIESGPDDSRGEALASWVLITRNCQFFTLPALAAAHPLETNAEVALWTDQYTSLLPILRWTGRH